MAYDQESVADRLRRWEAYLTCYSLPRYDELPGIPLYMDQVLVVVGDSLSYLSSLSSDGAGEKLLTPAMVNNYVKMKLLPPPVRKKYGREQLACLIMISALKQSLSISEVKKLLPRGDADSISADYDAFVDAHRALCRYVSTEASAAAAPLLNPENASPLAPKTLALRAAIAANLVTLFAEKLVALDVENDAAVSSDGRRGKPKKG